MNLPAGLDPTMLVAAVGGLVVVIALGMGARAMFGRRKDEVIERLERATSSGMDVASAFERERPPEKKFELLASFLRPLARLVKPSAAEEQSRLNRSLIHAGYRTDNAVEIFLGVKLLIPSIVII